MRFQPKRIPVRPLPLQEDRKLESLRGALDAEDRARKTVTHQDRDGQRIDGVAIPASADTEVRHRLGRKPRGVQILRTQRGNRVSVDELRLTAETFTVTNQDATIVTCDFWVY